MKSKLAVAIAMSLLIVMLASMPALAAGKGKGAQPGGVVVGGHIETNDVDSTGRVCVNIAGDETCNDFGVSSGELHVVVPKNDVDNTVVRVEFYGPDGGIAEEADGTACNREVLAYTDVMSFCYRAAAADHNPTTSPDNTLDRFNLVIVQQSPQDRCEPGGDPVGDRILRCKGDGGGDGT